MSKIGPMAPILLNLQSVCPVRNPGTRPRGRKPMNKNSMLWVVAGFVVALVVARILGFDINPF